MVDFTFLPSEFSATEIIVVANTKEARQYLEERYGFACVSINVRKSKAPEVVDSLMFQNFSFE